MTKKNDILYNFVVNLSKDIIKSSGAGKRKYTNYAIYVNNNTVTNAVVQCVKYFI